MEGENENSILLRKHSTTSTSSGSAIDALCTLTAQWATPWPCAGSESGPSHGLEYTASACRRGIKTIIEQGM